MINTQERRIGLPTIIALIALCGTGVGAWIDVKGDIIENAINTQKNEKADERIEQNLERLDDKVDRIIDMLLQDRITSEDE